MNTLTATERKAAADVFADLTLLQQTYNQFHTNREEYDKGKRVYGDWKEPDDPEKDIIEGYLSGFYVKKVLYPHTGDLEFTLYMPPPMYLGSNKGMYVFGRLYAHDETIEPLWIAPNFDQYRFRDLLPEHEMALIRWLLGFLIDDWGILR